MAKITNLENNANEIIFPVTRSEAVITSDGSTNIQEMIDEKADIEVVENDPGEGEPLDAGKFIAVYGEADKVTSEDIEDGAITTAKIDNSAVTSAKIADNAVTSAKIANNSVTSAKIDFSSLTYNVGDVIAFGGYVNLFGYVSSSSTTLYLHVPLSRRASLTGSGTYTFTCPTITIRGVKGYILNGVTWGSTYTCTVRFVNGSTFNENFYLRLDIKKADGTAFDNVTNNTPIAAAFPSGLTITRTA